MSPTASAKIVVEPAMMQDWRMAPSPVPREVT